jgi:PPOX class probable F420-dependent enzyme
VIATLMEDGTPHLSTIWVDVEDDGVVFITYQKAIKTVNLRRDPRVAITVIDQENPYRYVNIVGRVRSERTEGGPEMIDRLSVKYTGEPYLGHHLERDWVIFVIDAESVGKYASGLYA